MIINEDEARLTEPEPDKLIKQIIKKPKVDLTQETTAVYMRTVSLKTINLHYPDLNQIDINDIAYHLAGLLRWSGGTRPRLSVAEHLINCYKIGLSQGASKEFLRVLLLHDGEEYIYGDLGAPAKRECKDYQHLANILQIAIGFKYKAPFDKYYKELKVIDYKMARTENTYLRNNPKEDIYENFRFYCFKPDEAEHYFLEAFNACRAT